MWPHGESTAYFLRSLNFVTQALNIRLQVEWKRRRTDRVSEIADDLTHSNFSLVPSKVKNRRVSTLPQPILDTLMESCRFESHVYHMIVDKIKSFWNKTNVDFNENCLY